MCFRPQLCAVTSARFNSLTHQLKEALSAPLPGADAQYKMAPAGRRERSKVMEYRSPKIAAVMILLFPSADGTSFPLIQRPVYKGVHSAQISLPGGKLEETDANLQQTALRETHEEIGVAPHQVEVT